MSNNSSLATWLNRLGINKQLNNNDILSGITVNATLAKAIQNYTTKINTTNTASNRINNWNIIGNELEKIGIHLNQQEKGKILNGDDKVVYNILYEIKGRYEESRHQVEVDINRIDVRGDPKAAKSLLELFILVIIKYYGFSVKEAVALLSNDSKYLAHILAKGFKENPNPVEMMLIELQNLLPQITNFCRNKENEIFFLKSIKPGLISKFLSISELTMELLTMFVKNMPECFQIIKNQLMPTLILCLRRHGCQLGSIIKSLTQIIGYNKNLLSLFLDKGDMNEATLLMIEMLNQSELQNQISQVFLQFKIQQFIDVCIGNIKNSELFINSATFLIKMIEHNSQALLAKSQTIAKLTENLGALYLTKRSHVIIYSNFLFSFLHLLGKRKNQYAPQIFKLAVERYRSALNQDESHNYLFNFLQIVEEFPSIPTMGIAEAILTRYQGQTSYIGQLELDILLNSIQNIDQKLALKIYNAITKIFIQEVGSVEIISSLLEAIIRKFDSKIIFDLTVKFIKICLAVHYANIRKLNYSKSLIDGTIKLDKSNVFYKAKNAQIQKILTSIVLIRNQSINKALLPLVCYSFFQSQLKNKEEAEGIKRVMLMLGDEEELRNIYENEAKLMLEDVRNQGKMSPRQFNDNQRYKQKESQSKIRAISDASLLLKKRNFLYNSSNPPIVHQDALKGLQKYTRVYLQKVGKHSMEEDMRKQQQQRREQLKKKFTVKILQKGIKITKEANVNCIYQFNHRQKEMLKDLASDLSYLPFYDPQSEEDRDIKALEFLMKKYSKLFKVYYNNYSGKLRPNTVKLFEDISQRGNLMQSANVWRLLREHYLDQYITVNEVQYIIQKINAQLKKQYKDSSVLDYEVFEQFIVQASLSMFSRPPKDLRSRSISDMVQQMVNKLKEHAQQNRIDEKLFEQYEQFQSNKSQQIKELNQKLQQNPDYILPEGYKKQIIKRINFDYKFCLHALDESYKDAYQILDQILSNSLNFHIIQSYSVTTVEATARPILYQAPFDYSKKGRSYSSVISKSARPSHQQNKEGEQEQVQNGDNPQLSRVLNKFLKEKRQRQEQKRQKQEQYEKRREQRDRQLKALLEKHRQKQQQTQKQQEEARNEEAKKIEQQKRRREKYEQQLKKKVEEFNEKKRLEKVKEEQQLKKKKQQELLVMEKAKQDYQRKRKHIEETKQKKKYDEELKRKQQEQQLKKKQQEKRIKENQKKQRTKKMLEQYKQKKQKPKNQQSPSHSHVNQQINSPRQAQKEVSNRMKEATVQQIENSS